MTLGDLVAALGEWAWELIPARIVHPWQTAVRLRLGNVQGAALSSYSGVRGTGLHLFWPLLEQLILYDCSDEIVVTKPQTVLARGGKSVTADFVVTYALRDPALMLTTLYDVGTSVQSCIEASAAGWIPELTPRECAADLAETVLHDCKPELAEYGIALLSVQLRSCTPAPAVRLLVDQQAVPV